VQSAESRELNVKNTYLITRPDGWVILFSPERGDWAFRKRMQLLSKPTKNILPRKSIFEFFLDYYFIDWLLINEAYQVDFIGG
jgi:hypothetical protein